MQLTNAVLFLLAVVPANPDDPPRDTQSSAMPESIWNPIAPVPVYSHRRTTPPAHLKPPPLVPCESSEQSEITE